ncbi:LexA repressor [Deinococcus carri]|uniref:LexA repressor n=1 Tax=Deinococcus carri TaxID=1211323 RepID=A0ABP9W6Y0_9DEIO
MMTDEPRPRLTRRQREILQEIGRLERLGEPITTKRIGEALGLKRQNLRVYLVDLQNRGLVRYEAEERQTGVIRLSEEGWQMTGAELPGRDLRFPILGEIAAGQPTLAEGQIEAYATRLQDVLDLHEGDFLLKVRGDSMTGIGIYPGDLVAIRPQQEEPLSGEIVLVTLPNENTATLKRWSRNNGTVTLASENPAYAPMTFKVEEVLIQGCMVGHIGTGRSRRTGNGE